jgi:hypothetical protein
MKTSKISASAFDNVKPILDKYFKYDKIFDLYDFDMNLPQLHEELRQLKKQEYEPNYRFVFLHYDTDYYITNDQPGILLRNLQKIIWSLDISNYFCLILSQQDLQPELDRLRIEETTDDVSIACITHCLQDLMYLPQQAHNKNFDGVEKHYICLNLIPRIHRICMFVLLQYNQLLDKGLVSYGFRNKS